MSQSEQDQQSKNGVGSVGKADSEVVSMARRRQFSRAYKLRILAEAEQCQRGEVGVLLRREGLYSSVLSKWRQQKAVGRLDSLSGSQEQKVEDQAKELRRLRREGKIENTAVYVVLGVDLDGHRDVLGHWIGDGSEGANFWLSVVTDLQARGVQDIFVASVDGLAGFKEAIQSIFPQTQVQRCIIHQDPA